MNSFKDNLGSISLGEFFSGSENWDFLQDIIAAVNLFEKEPGDHPYLDSDRWKTRKQEALESALAELTQEELKQLFPPTGSPKKEHRKLGSEISQMIDDSPRERQDLLYVAAYWAHVKSMTRKNVRSWGQGNYFFTDDAVCPNCSESIRVNFKRDTRKTVSRSCPSCGHYWDTYKRCRCPSCINRSSAILEAVSSFKACVDAALEEVDWDRIDTWQRNASTEAESLESENNRCLAFVKNRWKLSADEREFLDACRRLPSLHHEDSDMIEQILDTLLHPAQRDKVIRQLIKKQALIQSYNYEKLPKEKIRLHVTNEFNRGIFTFYDFGRGSGSGANIFDEQDSVLTHSNLRFTMARYSQAGSDLRDNIVELYKRTPRLTLNRYFLEEKTEPMESVAQAASNALIKIFGSPHEENYYQTLQNQYPGKIILPNYPVRLFVDFKNKDLKAALTSKEKEYLPRSRVDFLIANQNETPEVVVELQIGQHHRKGTYKKRDNAKLKLFELCGIKMLEEFGHFHKSYMT